MGVIHSDLSVGYIGLSHAARNPPGIPIICELISRNSFPRRDTRAILCGGFGGAHG
jgi:hypothetical protein